MTRDTRIALFLMGELVAALRANDSDAFRGDAGAWSDRGGRAAAGLALLVPHNRGAGQADWLAPGGEPLTSWLDKTAK